MGEGGGGGEKRKLFQIFSLRFSFNVSLPLLIRALRLLQLLLLALACIETQNPIMLYVVGKGQQNTPACLLPLCTVHTGIPSAL